MVEQLTFNQLVRGSSPRPATSNKTMDYNGFYSLEKNLPQHSLNFPLIGRIAQW